MELGKRTASLFPHHVALLMLGGDSRFEQESDWQTQYRGFSQLAACLAGRPELGAELRLATPAEYFSEVRHRSGPAARLPLVSGDLHVYAARRGRPWSGYYTRLPHWRRAARQLEAQLNAAELLYAWAWSRHRQRTTLSVFQHAYKRLSMSRQDVALFNHHRAATGTVAPHVLADYVERLDISQQDLTHTQLTGTAELLLDLELYGRATELFAEHSPLLAGLGEPPRLIEFTVRPGQRRRLLLFNSLAQQRTELVTLLVRRPGAAVTDDSGRPLDIQFSADRGPTVRAQFLARLEPLALHVFHVMPATTPAVLNAARSAANLSDTFTISNSRFELTVSKMAGIISLLDRRDDRRRPFGVSVVAMVAASPTVPHDCDPHSWTVQEGSVISEASVDCGRTRLIVRLIHSDCALGQAIHVQAETRPPNGTEPADVALLLRTDLKSCAPRGCGFYADANDYRMVWRPHVPAAGVAANVYPATTQVSLEDPSRRVSLLMDHSRGVASFEHGVLTVVLDSQFEEDSDGDDSGEEGGPEGHESRSVLASFTITFDYLPESESESESVPTAERLFAPSALTSALSRRLNHPPVALFSSDPWAPPVHTPLRLLTGVLPCGWELLTLRQLSERDRHEVPGEGAQLTLLRRRLDCRLWDVRDGLGCRPEDADTAQVDFFQLPVSRLRETTLTGGRLSPPVTELSRLYDVRLRPDELRSFELSFVPMSNVTTTHRPDPSELALVRYLNQLDDDAKL